MDIRWLEDQFPDLENLQPLASGGQKEVFSADHEREGKVVLKILRNESGIERLKREILACTLIGCERVPTIFGTDKLDSQVGECTWICEQLINGTTLRERLKSGPADIGGLVKLGIQILEVLCDAEIERIVHRDIKPDNIMIDLDGNFWLLDFGLARHLDLESLTASAVYGGVGTLGYSAPEQMQNRKRDIDIRADLFALGVTMYEYGTGSNPFREGARDSLEILNRVERMPFPALTIDGCAESGLLDFISALTQKHLTQRPRTAREAMDWIVDISRHTP